LRSSNFSKGMPKYFFAMSSGFCIMSPGDHTFLDGDTLRVAFFIVFLLFKIIYRSLNCKDNSHNKAKCLPTSKEK